MRAPDDLQGIWADPIRLAAWTFEQRHQADLEWLRRSRPEGFREENYPPLDPRRALNLQLIVEARECDQQIRDALRQCRRRGDYDEVIEHSPELVGYLRNGRGRPAGSDDELYAALYEVGEVRQLWKRVFGKTYRKGSSVSKGGRLLSLAIEIAAERYGLKAIELDDFRRNR
jgi:hypothetical protein